MCSKKQETPEGKDVTLVHITVGIIRWIYYVCLQWDGVMPVISDIPFGKLAYFSIKDAYIIYNNVFP